MYETAIVNKEEFEIGLSEILNDVCENGQQYYFAGISLAITKGVVYVVEKLGAVFVLKLVEQFMNDDRILAARLLAGTKNLLTVKVLDDHTEVSLYVGECEVPMVTANIENRPDLPKVKVSMIMGNEALYLLAED